MGVMAESFDPAALPMPDLGAICRECGYLLVGLSEHRCPECGWRFTLDDLIPEGDPAMVRIRGCPVPLTPRVREVLGIAELFAPAAIATPYSHGHKTPIELYLHADRGEYFHVVHELIRSGVMELINERHVPTPQPQQTAPQPSGPDWTCTGCGEANPAQFEVCWNCAIERGAP